MIAIIELMAVETIAPEPRIEPLLLKPGEVAALLGISRSRAYEMLRAVISPASSASGDR